MAAIRQEFADCKAYGGTTVLVVPAVVNRKVGYRDAYKRSQKNIRELIPDAEKHGIKIAIEEVWNKFLLSPVEFARYIDEFESPWVGAYFDVGNVVEFGYPGGMDPRAGKRILKVHIKEYAKRKAFQLPAGRRGEIDWAAVRTPWAPPATTAGSQRRSAWRSRRHERRRPTDGPPPAIELGRASAEIARRSPIVGETCIRSRQSPHHSIGR